jgi:hypothetical protein
MLRPDGAHLFVRRKFSAIGLRKRFVKRGFFLGTQLKHGLICPSQLQEHAGKIVLHFRGETAHSLDSLFKKFHHNRKIDLSLAVRKDFRGAILPLYSAPEKPFSIKGLFDVRNS